MSTLIAVSDAMRHFLAEANVQREVKVVIVVPNIETKGHIESAILSSLTKYEMLAPPYTSWTGSGKFRLNGIEFSIAVPKQTVEI